MLVGRVFACLDSRLALAWFVANQVMVELGKALSGYDSKQFKEVRNHLEELPCVDKPADLVLCCASVGSLEDSKWLLGPELLVAKEMCWSLHRH